MAAPACTLNFDFENLIGESTGYAVLTLAGFLPQAPRTVGGVLAGITYSTAPAANTATVTVYSNAVLLPQNTYYLVTIFTADGRPVVQNVPYYLNDGTFNFQSLVPVGIPIPNVVVPTNSASANTFFAGPTSGSPQAATFRAIGNSDLTGISVWDGVTIYADRIGGADNSAKIQAAINLLPTDGGFVDARGLPNETSGGSVANIDPLTRKVTLLLGTATTYVKTITLRDNFHIIGMGGSNAASTLQSADTTSSMFVLDQTSDTQAIGVLIQGLRCYAKTGNTTQIGLHMVPAVNGGGLWYSTLNDVWFGGTGSNEFGGGSLVFDSNVGGTPAGLNQFLTFESVRAYRQSGNVNAALHVSNYNGQFSFNNCEFDGITGDTTANACNIRIDDGSVNFGAPAPYSMTFINTTVQFCGGTASNAIQLNGTSNITFLNCHFENCTAIINQNFGFAHGNWGNSVRDSFIVTSAQGAFGYLVNSDINSSMYWDNNNFFGTPTNYFSGNTTFITANQSYNFFGGNVGLRSLLSSPTINGTPTGTGIPTITAKNGSGTGNYVTANTSYTVVDATNLSYTATIPTGWKLLIQASGNVQTNTGSATAGVALFVDPAGSNTTLAESFTINVAGAPSTFSLASVFTGDGASHVFQLFQRTSNASDSVSMTNTSITSSPKMTFLLTPSN